MSRVPDPQRRLKVLVVGEATNPKLTSVALIGWSCSQALKEVADVHLVTEQRNRDDLVAAGLREGADFTAVDNRFWQGGAWKVGTWLRGGTTLGWSTYSALTTLVYPFFERKLWRQFRTRLAAHEFDVVHRLTPLAPVVPSLLARRCAQVGVPFVLGPLNGGVPWPKEFSGVRKAEKEWMSRFREAYRILPGFHSTRRYSSAILIAARFAWAEMPPQYLPKCIYLPENAIDPARFPRRTPPAPSQPLRIAFVGRLVPLKGVDLLLEASAPLAREGRLALDIIGDGPELPRLKQMVQDLGIVDRVEFPGWVPHHELADRLGRSQVFGFPSIREFGGGVVLEAMALGQVPVVVDYGGPGELVPPGTGFALPMAPRAQLIQTLRDTFTRLLQDPAATAAMGRAAQEYVYRNFTWSAKAHQLQEVYDWVTGRRTVKPDWGMPLK
jgi:starch synthase